MLALSWVIFSHDSIVAVPLSLLSGLQNLRSGLYGLTLAPVHDLKDNDVCVA